jgi:hypothetical protein
MKHRNLVGDFETSHIDNSTFSHTEHVYVIWTLIHTHGTLEAIRRFELALKRITTEAGRPEKYNATITYALAFLVAERITEHPLASWDDFAARNSDLLTRPNSALTRPYSPETLHSPKARQSFVLPATT